VFDTSLTFDSPEEYKARADLGVMLNKSKLPHWELLRNMGLFIDSKNMARILFFNHLYQMIVDKQGVIMDFGTRYGHNMALFESFRGIYEPFNRHRKIVGFDTFTGFPSISPEDGQAEFMKEGGLKTPDGYTEDLVAIMECHERLNSLNHIKKYEICKGDATEELDTYLEQHPETIVALAYFDFDIYEPTVRCLRRVEERMPKGSIIGFDELNDPDSPGETLALNQVLGIRNYTINRWPHCSRTSYIVL